MAIPLQSRRPFWRRARLAPLLLATAAVPLLVFFILPLVALLLRIVPATFVRYLGDEPTVQAIALSLATSLASLAFTLALGTPLAYLLAHGRLRGRSVLEAAVDLPTVLPPAVAGIALLMAFGRRGVAGSWLAAHGVQIAFTPIAVVMAQTFVAAPYYIKSAAVGLASVSMDLLEAASLDGASPLQRFRLVTLPLARRGILGGAALCWSRALGEFGATIIFAGNYPGRTQTMPLAVYIGFEIDLNRALTLAAILLVISFTVLLTVRALQER